MTEFKLTIDAPGIVGALNNLADALRSRPVGVQAVSSNVIPATEEKPVEAPVAPVEYVPANPTVPMTETATTATTAPAGPVQTANSHSEPVAAPVEAPAPVAEVKSYTIEDITNAGSALLDAGKMAELMNLLAQHGVQALTQLKPEQFADVAAGLRALGAKI